MVYVLPFIVFVSVRVLKLKRLPGSKRTAVRVSARLSLSPPGVTTVILPVTGENIPKRGSGVLIMDVTVPSGEVSMLLPSGFVTVTYLAP